MSRLRNSTLFYENVCKSISWDFKDLKLLYNLHLSYIYRRIYDLNSETSVMIILITLNSQADKVEP